MRYIITELEPDRYAVNFLTTMVVNKETLDKLKTLLGEPNAENKKTGY